MKKLLLLGGSRYILPIIEAAKKLGVYTITCDYLPDNIAHKYSDEYCNVSIIDKEAVLEIAKKLQIDGIMSFACDPGVATAAYVAQKLNLPTCAPYESVSILQNKGLFRKFLSDNGFCVPTAKKYTDIRDAMQETEMFHWPVIVKPTDSAGSKGVTKVNTPEELEESVRYALSFSHSKEFIIEDFIEKQGYSSDSDCFSINGELVFCSFSDQRFDNCAANPYTPSAYSWPSSMPQQVQAELRSELQRLIRLLKLDTSIYNIETRWGTDGKPYIMEVSPRGGGNRLSEMLRLTSGVDLVTNAVRMALGEEIEGVTGDPVYDGCWAEIILHSEQDGAFDHLQIAPELQPCVKEIQLWVSKGDEIHTFTGANFAIGTLVLKFEDAQSLEYYVNNINDYVKVIVG
ncbi:MAG: ATP-grasp domain-containing protein [Ruminococcaceae bacterium]|nr:ATP-grasp domain-containing protein [Oscillospiraceae bacterium]